MESNGTHSIIRIVQLQILNERVKDFINTFESICPEIKATPGCRVLELWKDTEQGNTFYTYSLWDDAHALKNYRDSQLFKDTWAKVKPWFEYKAKAWSARRYNSKS